LFSLVLIGPFGLIPYTAQLGLAEVLIALLQTIIDNVEAFAVLKIVIF